MALKPSSEESDLAVPGDHHDDPADWGWHGEWGRASRVGGWVTAIVLLLFATSTHYNEQGTLFLGIGAGVLVVILIWDRQRRRNAWRQ